MEIKISPEVREYAKCMELLRPMGIYMTFRDYIQKKNEGLITVYEDEEEDDAVVEEENEELLRREELDWELRYDKYADITK